MLARFWQPTLFDSIFCLCFGKAVLRVQILLGSVVLPDNSTPVRHSSVFGLPHLLRLFEVFVEDFANLPQDAEPILSLKMMTSEFVVFLADNRDKYFSVRRDYEPQE
ncbi:unnamed protein product [Nippostrongylus brasiliensis]|uniref:MRG domain-containing protein n=1 Tax=Nippostrongylus brasiliensis TaxID=27835 RepID=A0A0N4XQ52_NIPBR|nr:unnamed protein product [Nippostrongylus brasiliensis]